MVTAPGTCPGSPPGCPTSPTWVSTACGCRRSIDRRWPMPAMTWPTIGTSIRASGRWPTSTRSSRGPTTSAWRCSSTSCPITRLTSIRGSRRRWRRGRGRPNGLAISSATDGAPPANCRRTTGDRASVDQAGPGSPSRTADPASGICTCSTSINPTLTGRARTCGPSSSRCCASGWTVEWPASGSTSPTASSRRRGCPISPGRRRSSRPSRRTPARSGTRTACTRCMPRGVGCWSPTDRPTGCCARRPGSALPSGWPAICDPRRCIRGLPSTSSAAVGTQRNCARSSMPSCTRWARWAPQAPGCCPTTTSSGTPVAWAPLIPGR